MSDILRQKLMVLFVSITLIFAFVGFLVLNQSLAWFSENKEVTADGLSLNAKVSPNLIIGKSVDEIQSEGVLFSVNFGGTARSNMIAVTHDSSIEGTYLKYLTSHHAVDNHTGLKNGTAELEFAAVPTADNEPYFIDYVVYIASAFEELEVSSLKAKIVIPEDVDSLHPYFNAASIDFYLGEVSADSFIGTTSVADSLKNTARAEIDLFKNAGGTVPFNEDGYMTVIMRCYFDGALTYVNEEDGKTYAYVNSYTVKSDGVVIGVDFTATDKAE
jgi:hypothetical protein